MCSSSCVLLVTCKRSSISTAAFSVNSYLSLLPARVCFIMVCMCVSLCMCVRVSVCVSVCVCIYIFVGSLMQKASHAPPWRVKHLQRLT